MNKYIYLLAIILSAAFAANAQTGSWSGDLNVGGSKLPLVFNFDEDKPTVDSPAQGAKGLPMQVDKDESGAINITIPSVGASFQGALINDRIVGYFKQGGALLPLTLSPGADKLRRPQTPVAPGPYAQEEVTFSNGDALLSGTLTLPDGYDRSTPVLLMVTGSGLQNRDEEILDHKPFAVIADALARNGIATLRYDDRGFGRSTGDAANSTTQDLMLDALAGVNLLRGRFDNVGVLGHSEGGTIALMLGADKKVDFIVSLAGMAVSGRETLLAQNRLILTDAGVPANLVDEYCRLLTRIFDNDPDFEKQLDASALPATLKQNLKAVDAQMQRPYMQHFVSLDMRDRLDRIACPVLAINGKKDTQVFCNDNLEALKAGLPANSRNKIMALDGLNHMLQHCVTGAVTEYGVIEETISPEVLSAIAQWVNSLHNDL